MKLSKTNKQILVFALTSVLLLFIMSIPFSCNKKCEKKQKASTLKQDLWRSSKGEICMVNINDIIKEYNNAVVYFAKTNKGEMAFCIKDEQSNEPVLLAVAGKDKCNSFSGEVLPQKNFQTFICQIPEKTNARMHPLKSGKIIARDKYKLVSGGLVELIGFEESSEESGLSMAVSVESLLAHVYRPKGGVFKSYFACDFDFDFPDDLRDVIYGTYENADGPQPATFAIANSSVSPGEVLVTFEISEPGLRIAIVGNELNNHITTLAVPFVCTGGEIIQPCNQDWDLEAMIIAGHGGNDQLHGLTDVDTKNVIFGDYACGSGPEGAADGNDHISGGRGDDILCGEQGNDWIRGLSGDDKIFGNLNNCEFVGESDNDRIWGGPGDDEIYGDFPDSGETQGGRDIIHGMAGNDKIFGGPGNDDIFGESFVWASLPDGNDVICGGAGRDFLSPGPGHDEIFYKESDDDILESYPGEPYSLDLWSQTDCPYWPPE